MWERFFFSLSQTLSVGCFTKSDYFSICLLLAWFLCPHGPTMSWRSKCCFISTNRGSAWSYHSLSYWLSRPPCCWCCSPGSFDILKPLNQLPPCSEANVVWIKTLCFYFTNKESGVRCWGESQLAQKQRKQAGDLPSLLSFQKEGCPLHHLKQNSSNQMSLPSISCASLSLQPSNFSLLSMVTSSQSSQLVGFI